MTAGYLALEIVKGVYPVPGNTANLNQSVDVLNLLVGTRGFGVAMNGWMPKYPQMRGVSQTNSMSDGSNLLNYSMPNVIETMKLVNAGSTPQTRYALFSRLVQFGRWARDFHVTRTQTEPVYLKWHPEGCAYPQYALLYNIDIAQDTDVFLSDDSAELSITLEREPYWQVVPPGFSPRLWGLQRTNTAPSTGAVGVVDTGFGGTVYGFVRRENSEAGAFLGGYTNALDIAANLIPGDTRLKTTLSFYAASTNTNNAVVIGNWPKPITAVISGTTYYSNFTFNGADVFAAGADTTSAADTGAPVCADGTQKRGVTSFATTATDAVRYTWKTNSAVFNGQFLAFARMRLSAAGTVKFYLTITTGTSTAIIAQTTQQFLIDTGTGGTGNTGEWAFMYMGVVTVPPIDSAITANLFNGYGAQGYTLTINLYALRSSGTPSLYLADLNFIPSDHSMIALEGDSSVVLTSDRLFADNTGYSLHGKTGQVAGKIISNGIDSRAVIGLGSYIELEPNTDNRLYVLPYKADTRRSIIGTSGYTLLLNPVPRWLGPRAV